MASLSRRAEEGVGRDPSRSATGGIAGVVNELLVWAHGRLPGRARRRVDTADLVQQVLTEAIPRLDEIDPTSPSLLRNYLKKAIRHRIIDEVRRSAKVEADVLSALDRSPKDPGPTQLDAVIASEDRRRFHRALATLSSEEQLLLVGRINLGLSYAKLALASGRPTADAARVATRRAVLRLAHVLGTLNR